MTQQRGSIDGFVPSSQGRHVGFGYDPHKLNAASQFNSTHNRLGHTSASRIRMRRPGLHASPPGRNTASAALAGPSLATTRLTEGNNFPGFTTYSTSAAQGSDDASNYANGRPGSGKGLNGSGNRPRRRFGRRSKSSGLPDGRETNQRSKYAKKQRRGFSFKKAIKRTALVLFLLLLVGGGYFGYKFAHTTAKVFGDGSSVLGFLNSSTLKGEDKGRVNILIAGVSTDDPGHDGADLTDSIMLISLDTVNHKAFLLSVPRDLWVNIPGYGHSKINAANAYGDTGNFSQTGYPTGGMGLLEQIVSTDLQVPIDYYAKINYSAFRDAVNAVGGISVNIQSDDKRGFYDPNISKADQGPLKLANGIQTLNGQTALNFARARGDPTGDGRVAYGYARSDFTRTQNQRLMLLALKDKITSGGVITNPVKISDLFDTISKNMKTDLKPSEIRRLYDINKQVQSSDVSSLSLNDADGVNLLASATANGQSILAPAAGIDNFGPIQLYVKKQSSNDPVVKESAKVVILNGGDITGLATKMSNYATSKGINVVAVDDGPRTTGANIIIDQTAKTASGASGKPGTKARLLQLFGTNSGSTASAAAGYPSADFIVILGTDQQAPAATAE